MAIIYKPGVYTIVHLVKFLCRFVNKHEGTARAVLVDVLSPQQLSEYDTFVTALQVLCGVFNAVYPLIKP